MAMISEMESGTRMALMRAVPSPNLEKTAATGDQKAEMQTLPAALPDPT